MGTRQNSLAIQPPPLYRRIISVLHPSTCSNLQGQLACLPHPTQGHFPLPPAWCPRQTGYGQGGAGTVGLPQRLHHIRFQSFHYKEGLFFFLKTTYQNPENKNSKENIQLKIGVFVGDILNSFEGNNSLCGKKK